MSSDYRIVEYDDCIAIEYGPPRIEDEESIAVSMPSFWSSEEMELEIGVIGERIVSVSAPKDLQEEELKELSLVRWKLSSGGSPADSFADFDLDGKTLHARYPRLRGLRFGREAAERFLAPPILPSTAKYMDLLYREISRRKPGKSTFNFHSHRQWLRRFRHLYHKEELEWKFRRQLRQEREAILLLSAAGVETSLRRVDAKLGKRRIKKLGLDPDEATSWAAISTDFERIVEPFCEPEGKWAEGKPAKLFVSMHSAQHWLDDDGEIDYFLVQVLDDGDQPLEAYSVWAPWIERLPFSTSRDVSQWLIEDADAKGLPTENMVVDDRIQPVKLCPDCGELEFPVYEKEDEDRDGESDDDWLPS